ncbi:MAG: HAD-IA family hydrolase [Betaproteobacteria bacterium]
MARLRHAAQGCALAALESINGHPVNQKSTNSYFQEVAEAQLSHAGLDGFFERILRVEQARRFKHHRAVGWRGRGSKVVPCRVDSNGYDSHQSFSFVAVPSCHRKFQSVSMAIEHILFDADGVLQYAARHWQPALQSVLQLENESEARAVVEDILEAETAVLDSATGFTARLEAKLAKWDRSEFVAETLDVLHAIEVHHDVMQAVQDIRRSGIQCHIGSNQQALRARHMSETLNYKSLFDSEFYSCFIGAAKPRARFFEHVVAKLGCVASAVLFLDDRPENVVAAEQAGLNAMVFFGTDGALSLRRRLVGFGVLAEPCTQKWLGLFEPLSPNDK